MKSREFSFGGVPVYNPQSLSKQEAIAQFHARKGTYQSILELLGQERPSHMLIIGTRGMGKTTLLQRVRYGVEDAPDLSARYAVLAFPEEQYGVNRLHHFLLNAVDALADGLERAGNEAAVTRVEAFGEELSRSTPEEIAARVPAFLAEIGKELGHEFLLLVDNADRLLETIPGTEQWQLRELLASRSDLTFVGATTQASEGIYGADRAFLDFFRIYQLGPLTVEEVRKLLLELSDSVTEEDGGGSARARVEKWLEDDPARLRTLVQLTGGNPRTTVLLFHLVLDGLAGGAREYLERLLDQVTPNYKGRVDELPPQSQQVLDAVAMHWDPVTALEVAERTGLETNLASSQLTRLVRQGLLEKADAGDSKKALYQVAERFFNIWYLMRASRRVRARLRWFVEFLRVFFEPDQLERMALERIENSHDLWRDRPEDVETAFAYAAASRMGRRRLEDYLRERYADMMSVCLPYLEAIEEGEDRSGLPSRGAPTSPTVPNGAREAEREVEAILEKIRCNSVDLGEVMRLVAKRPECRQTMERAFRNIVEVSPDQAEAWRRLGTLLLVEPGRHAEAEAAFRKAIDLDPSDADSWYRLSCILTTQTGRAEEARLACRIAIELAPTDALPWNNLGVVLSRSSGQAKEAEDAYRNAIALDPGRATVWSNLGVLLSRLGARSAEAESAYRKAIELKPESHGTWQSLGLLLASQTDRLHDAEGAFRKAAELNPRWPAPWRSLSGMLGWMTDRRQEAEDACRKAIELDPGDAHSKGTLGVLLACRLERPAEAETAFREALKLDPNWLPTVRNLGVLLYCERGRPEEAIEHLQRACNLEPNSVVSKSILGAALRGLGKTSDAAGSLLDDTTFARAEFWAELLPLCQNYAPFGKILLGICALAEEQDPANRYAALYRAVALGRLRDFPRASVALEDALTGDPIEVLKIGQRALETFWADAVRAGRVRECLDVIEKKGWTDAWRPIYEALKAVEAGSAEYLKRVAVEIREPALVILGRIAPGLQKTTGQ
jgi:Flp pilus assembly protein TadD